MTAVAETLPATTPPRSRSTATYARRRALGLCALCPTPSKFYMCAKHRRAKTAAELKRRDPLLVRICKKHGCSRSEAKARMAAMPFIPAPGAYLSLQKEDRGSRRLVIGKAFASDFRAGDLVLVKLGSDGIVVGPVSKSCQRTPMAYVLRSYGRSLYVTLPASKVPESLYPTKKYWATRRYKWITGSSATFY